MLVRNIIGKMLASSTNVHGPQGFSILLEPKLFSDVDTVLVIYFKLNTRISFVAGRRFKNMAIQGMEYM